MAQKKVLSYIQQKFALEDFVIEVLDQNGFNTIQNLLVMKFFLLI